MADEEKKKTSDEAGDSGGSSNIMGRIGGYLIDGLAQKNPIIGLPLQAAFNTEGYQDRQLRRQAAKEALIASRAINEEWQRNAPVREAQSAASLAKARLAEAMDDDLYKKHIQRNYASDLKKDLAMYPAFNNLPYSNRDELVNSPRFHDFFDAHFYTEQVIAIGNKDQNAYKFMDRTLRRNGYGLVDGEDEDGNSIKYLIDKAGNKIPATKDMIDLINRKVANSALEELNTYSMIADTSTMGNPAKRSIAIRTKALMPYNGNDATNSYQMLQQVYDGADDSELGWHMFNQAITDYRSSGLPQKAKLDGLASCMNYLPQMGYALDTDGVDQKNPNPEAITVIDLKNKTRMSFSEFAERCKENDTLGKRLDETIASARKSAIARDKEIFAREVAETQQALRLKQLNAPPKVGNGKGNAPAPATVDKGNSDDLGRLKKYDSRIALRNQADREKMKELDDHIIQFGLETGLIKKGKNGKFQAEDTASLRKISDEFEASAKSLGLKNVKNPWTGLIQQSSDNDKKSLQSSTVPAARKNVERLYERHKEQLAKMGIGDLDTAIRYAEELPDYGVGLGAASDPDRVEKQKIIGELRKAVRGWRKYSLLAR